MEPGPRDSTPAGCRAGRSVASVAAGQGEAGSSAREGAVTHRSPFRGYWYPQRGGLRRCAGCTRTGWRSGPRQRAGTVTLGGFGGSENAKRRSPMWPGADRRANIRSPEQGAVKGFRAGIPSPWHPWWACARSSCDEAVRFRSGVKGVKSGFRGTPYRADMGFHGGYGTYRDDSEIDSPRHPGRPGTRSDHPPGDPTVARAAVGGRGPREHGHRVLIVHARQRSRAPGMCGDGRRLTQRPGLALDALAHPGDDPDQALSGLRHGTGIELPSYTTAPRGQDGRGFRECHG